MNCPKCGAKIDEGSKFCDMCGAPIDDGNVPNERNSYGGQGVAPEQPFWEDGGGFDTGVRFDTKKIRKWFRGKSLKVPIFVTVMGFLMVVLAGRYDTAVMVFGILVLVAGIAACVLTYLSAFDVSEVDRAWNTYVDLLPKRGFDKLNMIQEQVSLIKPIVLAGFGEAPDSSFESANQTIDMILDYRKKIRLRKGTKDDPYEAERIGKDDILRSMLLSVTVYIFTEEQVLIYTGNIDISTGLIYRERTEEVFYQDIEGIRFRQNVFKVYSMNKKKYVNKLRETMELYLSGCTLKSSYRTELNASLLQEGFTAMRNLIRDKKKCMIS